MRIRDKVKYAVRAWLGLGRLNDQASHIRIDVEMVSRMQASAENRLMELQTSVSALRDAEERHYRDRLKAEEIVITAQDRQFRSMNSARVVANAEHKAQSTELLDALRDIGVGSGAKLDQMLLLLEPQVAKLHAPRRPPAPDWNQVEQENLKQFEDGKNNG